MTRRIAILMQHNQHVLEMALSGIQRFQSERPDYHFIIETSLAQFAPDELDGILGHLRLVYDYAWFEQNPIPAVSILRGGRELPSVTTDYVIAAELGVAHFLERGISHFGYFFDGASYGPSMSRYRAFRDQLKVYGHRPKKFVKGRRTRERGAWRLEDQLADLADWLAKKAKPFGLYCSNLPHGLRAIEACRLGGLRVPDEVALVVVGGSPPRCQFANPPLTNIEINGEALGYEAAKMLASIIETGQHDGPKTLFIPPKRLVVRRSSDTYAVADADVRACLIYLHEHLDRAVRIDDLAGHVHISRTTLCQKFQTHLGVGPGEVSRRIRIDEAVRLLRETSLPLADVAVRCGFKAVSQISRDLKKYTGQSASALRGR